MPNLASSRFKLPRLSQDLQRRLLRGVRTQQGHAVLRYRRVYILPTRNGLMFAGLLAVLWVGAINYNNSLAFILAFLLGAVAMVSILHTFRNLIGLKVSAATPEPVFAGDEARFPILLESRGSRARTAIGLQYQGEMQGITDVPATHAQRLELRMPAPQRGWLSAERFALFTIYPLGLFKAWSWVDLDARCVVYPAPEQGAVPAPPGGAAAERGTQRGRGAEDFDGLRAYRTGDPPRHIAWRSVARGLPPQTKTFTGEASSRLWLEWRNVEALPRERALSRLCRWIVDAEAEGRPYGLRLPGIELAPAQGPAHYHRCLRSLALFAL